MKKLLFLFQIFLLQSIALSAQVGIGTDTPDPSAVLDLNGNNKKGILMPQVEHHDSINNPKPGLMVYDKHIKAMLFYDGKDWIGVNDRSKTVVADIENNYLQEHWRNEACRKLYKLTMEVLVRARSFNGINALMGHEYAFMIHIGGAGFADDQIQVYSHKDKFPKNADDSKKLPLNQWVHIAVTYDVSTSKLIIYVNGELQSETNLTLVDDNHKYIDFITEDRVLGVKKNFYIGHELDDTGSFIGEISECRIWNVVRTQEQIANHRYSVEPNAEGLVAYWKFDDGAGVKAKDYTANGSELEAKRGMLKWNYVSPP